MMQHLPIDYFKDNIVRTVLDNTVTIIQGGTGIGKSTRIPQYLAEHGYRVLITQPRRLAAISLTNRVASEMNCEVGTIVGYHTGIEKCYSSKDSQIIFLTDGLELLSQLFGKETLDNTVLIIDEIHEWSLNIETLIAWSKKQLEEGLNFKLVLMSATLDCKQLSNFFNQSCTIKIPPFSYPVSFEHKKANDIEDCIKDLVKERRNVLVFLPGKPEIRSLNIKLQALFRSYRLKAEILELHGDLDYSEQQKVFHRYLIPKVILSTNIAQTSITIPDIDAVVDTGYEKQQEVHESISSLCLRNISKADCEQRKGRAGRCKKGKYILCSDYSYDNRTEYKTPEIYLDCLDELILRLASINLEITDLDFFHKPDLHHIKESKNTLRLLGALDENNNITPLGFEMSRIPLSARYSRMLVESKKYDVQSDMLIITLLFEIGSIINKQFCTYPVSSFASHSDLFYELELFRSIYTNNFDVSTLDSMKHINSSNFRSILEQLGKICTNMNIDITKSSKNIEALKRCILCGLRDNLFIRPVTHYYYSDPLKPSRIISKNSILYKIAPSYVIGIPLNFSYFNSANKKVNLTLLSQCTAFTLDELLSYCPELFDVEFSMNNNIIYRDLYYSNMKIDSSELGSVDDLKQSDPEHFRNEIKEVPKFKQSYCYTYYYNLLVSAKVV